jgi:hypothetical protein
MLLAFRSARSADVHKRSYEYKDVNRSASRGAERTYAAFMWRRMHGYSGTYQHWRTKTTDTLSWSCDRATVGSYTGKKSSAYWMHARVVKSWSNKESGFEHPMSYHYTAPSWTVAGRKWCSQWLSLFLRCLVHCLSSVLICIVCVALRSERWVDLHELVLRALLLSTEWCPYRWRAGDDINCRTPVFWITFLFTYATHASNRHKWLLDVLQATPSVQ